MSLDTIEKNLSGIEKYLENAQVPSTPELQALFDGAREGIQAMRAAAKEILDNSDKRFKYAQSKHAEAEEARQDVEHMRAFIMTSEKTKGLSELQDSVEALVNMLQPFQRILDDLPSRD